MKPDNRTPREITYQVGWKRGKIRLSPDGRTPDASQPGEAAHISEHALHRWNRAVLWRKAPVPGGSRWLLAGLLALPAAVFALFGWAVYELSRYS